MSKTSANNSTGDCYLKITQKLAYKFAFRAKKVLTQFSIYLSMCENLGIRANSSQARKHDSCERDLGLLLLSFDLT